MKSFPHSLTGTRERLAHSVPAKVLADTGICKGLYICSIGRSVAPVGLAVVHPGPGREKGVHPGPGGVAQIRGGCPELIRTAPPNLDGSWKRLVSAVTLRKGMNKGNEGGG